MGFAFRLILTSHTAIPRERDFDFLTEAEAAFAPPSSRKQPKPNKPKTINVTATKAVPKKAATPRKKKVPA